MVVGEAGLEVCAVRTWLKWFFVVMAYLLAARLVAMVFVWAGSPAEDLELIYVRTLAVIGVGELAWIRMQGGRAA